jgi:hypothetical protein
MTTEAAASGRPGALDLAALRSEMADLQGNSSTSLTTAASAERAAARPRAREFEFAPATDVDREKAVGQRGTASGHYGP